MGKLWGIRFDDREFSVGDEIPKSHRYDNGVDTGVELSGTSTLSVSDEEDFLDYLDGKQDADYGELDAYHAALEAGYDGIHIYLVAIESSWGWEWGEDEGEMVMSRPDVVRVIR